MGSIFIAIHNLTIKLLSVSSISALQIKYDADAGHRLAGKDTLKDGELSLARRILAKYTAQLEQYDPSLIVLI